MRKMKDSGVEWIGEIPETWDLVQLGSLFFEHKHKNTGMQSNNLLSLSYGNIIRKDINTSDGLLPESFEGYNVIDDGDIVLRLTDLQNDQRSLRVGLSHEKGIVTSAYVTLRRRNPDLNSQFFYYLIHSYDVRKGFYGMGAGVRQGLNYAGVKKIMLTLPLVEEQAAIAAFLEDKLEKVDTLIANVQTQIEKLKAYKQSLITEAVTKGLDPTVPMKDSGVEWAPHIPDDWSVLPIGRVMYEKKERTKTGTETPLSVTQARGIILAENANVSNPTSSYIDWRCVEPEDIVFNKYKAHSGVFFVSPLAGIVTFNYSVYKCYKGFVPKYFEYQFKTAGCISEFRMSMRGVGESISPLYTRELFRIFALCPPKDVQDQIVKYLDNKLAQIDRLISLKQSKIEKLEQYKKSLIYEYVTGKKEVI